MPDTEQETFPLKLFQEKNYTDCIITAGKNSTPIYVHRAIVSNGSDLLDKLCKKDFENPHDRPLHFPNIGAVEMEVLLSYVYTLQLQDEYLHKIINYCSNVLEELAAYAKLYASADYLSLEWGKWHILSKMLHFLDDSENESWDDLDGLLTGDENYQYLTDAIVHILNHTSSEDVCRGEVRDLLNKMLANGRLQKLLKYKPFKSVIKQYDTISRLLEIIID